MVNEYFWKDSRNWGKKLFFLFRNPEIEKKLLVVLKIDVDELTNELIWWIELNFKDCNWREDLFLWIWFQPMMIQFFNFMCCFLNFDWLNFELLFVSSWHCGMRWMQTLLKVVRFRVIVNHWVNFIKNWRILFDFHLSKWLFQRIKEKKKRRLFFER